MILQEDQGLIVRGGAMLEPTWAMARPGSGQPFVICAGPAQERFSFIGKMKTFVLLARPEFLLSSATALVSIHTSQ
jgi:hypothetical protein